MWVCTLWMPLCFPALQWMVGSVTQGTGNSLGICALHCYWRFDVCLEILQLAYSYLFVSGPEKSANFLPTHWPFFSKCEKMTAFFSILVENVFHNVNICWWNALLIFHANSFFLLQSATWSIYNLCWLQTAYFLVLRKFSHYQSTAFIILYSTNIFTNGINN